MLASNELVECVPRRDECRLLERAEVETATINICPVSA